MQPLLPASFNESADFGAWTFTSGHVQSTTSEPLGSVTAGHLEFRRGITQLRLRGSRELQDLFQARFGGVQPSIETHDGHVEIRYPNFRFFDWSSWSFLDGDHFAGVTLNTSIPWQISMRGGLSEVRADLSAIDLTGFRVKGGATDAEVMLPRPSGIVPVHISGGASNLVFYRPMGCAVRLRVQGGVSHLQLDTQRFGAIGGSAEVVSPGFVNPTDFYDIQITGGVSNIRIESA